MTIIAALLALFALALFTSLPAHAHGSAEPAATLRSMDVVSYFKAGGPVQGQTEFRHDFDDARYFFSSAQSTAERMPGRHAGGRDRGPRQAELGQAQMNARKGVIVNVSSIAGALGIGSSVPYVASKGAVNAMTLHLARALAPEIRVNAVCSGLITTRWFKQGVGQQGYEALKAAYERSTLLRRACTAEDEAEAVIWLLDAAHTVTGELVLLNSGMHLGAPPAVVPAPH